MIFIEERIFFKGQYGRLRGERTLYFTNFACLGTWEKRYISKSIGPIFLIDSKNERKSKNILGVFRGFGRFCGLRAKNTL